MPFFFYYRRNAADESSSTENFYNEIDDTSKGLDNQTRIKEVGQKTGNDEEVPEAVYIY